MPQSVIVDSYSIEVESKNINLKVTIQHAQIAKSTVRVNQEVIGEYNDSFEVELLNTNNKLLGKVLYVDTTETDISPDTNMTSFKLELSGGQKAYENNRSQTVSEGSYVLYSAEIALIP